MFWSTNSDTTVKQKARGFASWLFAFYSLTFDSLDQAVAWEAMLEDLPTTRRGNSGLVRRELEKKDVLDPWNRPSWLHFLHRRPDLAESFPSQVLNEGEDIFGVAHAAVVDVLKRRPLLHWTAPEPALVTWMYNHPTPPNFVEASLWKGSPVSPVESANWFGADDATRSRSLSVVLDKKNWRRTWTWLGPILGEDSRLSVRLTNRNYRPQTSPTLLALPEPWRGPVFLTAVVDLLARGTWDAATIQPRPAALGSPLLDQTTLPWDAAWLSEHGAALSQKLDEQVTRHAWLAEKPLVISFRRAYLESQVEHHNEGEPVRPAPRTRARL